MGGTNSHIGLWLALVAIVLGPGLLLAGLLGVAIGRSRRAGRVHTTGEVISYSLGYVGASGDATMHPQVRFQTADGRVVTGAQRVSVDIGWYPSGGVDVWYDASDPQRFTTSRGWWDSPGALLAIVGGVLTVVVAVLFALFW